MGRQAALATGHVSEDSRESTRDCNVHGLLDDSGRSIGHVWITGRRGVEAISLDDTAIPTPEGIAAGSTLDAVAEAYGDFVFDELTMRTYPRVPGNDAAVYRIAYSGTETTGTVLDVSLQLHDQACYE